MATLGRKASFDTVSMSRIIFTFSAALRRSVLFSRAVSIRLCSWGSVNSSRQGSWPKFSSVFTASVSASLTASRISPWVFTSAGRSYLL